MHPIKAKVVNYLERANAGTSSMSEETIERAGRAFISMLHKRFNTQYNDDFRLRMSNIGRPTCQLQMKKAGAPAENEKYFFLMQMMIGDMHEIMAIAIMEAAGVNITSQKERAEFAADGVVIKGESDLSVDEGDGDQIWDVKSCSPWSFEHKFSKGFDAIAENDAFGYVSQGYSYAEGTGKKFGGWIAIQKVTGEWSICEAPQDVKTHDAAIERAKDVVKTVVEDAPFKRCFEDIEEKWYKKPTGNRTLDIACKYCEFKWTCWPGLQYLPSIPSKAKNPTRKYYTVIKETENDEC